MESVRLETDGEARGRRKPLGALEAKMAEVFGGCDVEREWAVGSKCLRGQHHPWWVGMGVGAQERK